MEQARIHNSVNYKRSYAILSAIFASIVIASYFASQDTLMDAMRVFMGLFFIIFGTFKVIGIKEFAAVYAGYDLIAGKVKPYGYLYPFVELGLGVAYLASYQLLIVNWITLVLMTVGAIGVWRARKRKIMCACLGTVVKLPLTTISLLEDILMAGMALIAILFM